MVKLVCPDCGTDEITAGYENHDFYCDACRNDFNIDQADWEFCEKE